MITICGRDTPTSKNKHSDQTAVEIAANWIRQHRGKRPQFACVLSFTETALLPHISAAGATANIREHTAALDGAFLLRHKASPSLPPLAAGISPAIISRAVLQSLSIPIHLLSTGLPVAINAPHIQLPYVQARSLETGYAMSLCAAEKLFSAGQAWGSQLAVAGGYLIVAECVVGGTTTAQAVLTALGYRISGQMSSSHRAGNHYQKQALVRQGMMAWQAQKESNSAMDSAMGAAAAMGDPMQLVAAGMMLSASQGGGVLLAGGSQMLAVYALAKAIAQQKSLPWQPQRVVVGTTRWVVEDRSADTVVIAQQIGVPYIASQINFGRSPYMQLRAYEQGFVKEGVGAGGCAIAAHLYQNWTQSKLRHAVEKQLRYSF